MLWTLTHLAVLLASGLLACSAAPAGSDKRPIVSVPGLGSLRGVVVNERVAVFRGVPYAKAPLRGLRWRAPEPHGPWALPGAEEPREAGEYGSACVPLNAPAGVDMSEDCLFLNVAAPMEAVAGGRRLPVVVYVHGGAFASGASNFGSPESLVLQSPEPLLVVTLNYRLHLFGFLGSLALRVRARDNSTGNYGIEDQRMALRWVADNIAAFGGSAADVTLFGESAGGSSVLIHLTQPASFGLYSRVVVDSGTYTSVNTLEKAEVVFQQLLNFTSCGDLDCLEGLETQQLRSAALSLPRLGSWFPVLDGVSLTGYPQDLIASGNYNSRVPVLLGSNLDEATNFGLGPSNMNEVELDGLLLRLFEPSRLAEVKGLFDPSKYDYPTSLGNFSQSWWQLMRIMTDYEGDARTGTPTMLLGHCSVRCMARAMVRGGTPRIFTYVFAQTTQEVSMDINEGVPTERTGPGSVVVPHASELPFVFGMTGKLGEANGEAGLARNMSSYWSTFAALGDPNREGQLHWPPYDHDEDTTMWLAAGASRSLSQFHGPQCDMFDRIAGPLCEQTRPLETEILV